MASIASVKTCLIGEFGVGKTSIIRRFTDNKFSEQYASTVGAKIAQTTITTDLDVRQIQLLIWDIEGNSKFKAFNQRYLEGASSLIVVGDLSCHYSLSSLKKYINFSRYVKPRGRIFVALNKADLVSEEKISSFVDYYLSPYRDKVTAIYVTSAKTGQNIRKMFLELGRFPSLLSL